MTSPNNGQEFDGTAAEMRDSPWLSAEDLVPAPGKQATVTIERVMKYRNVQFDKGRSKPEAYALKFAGKQRELVLNATNRKKLVELFGPKVDDWKRQKVSLYVSSTTLAGKTVPCIRIREPAPAKPEQEKTMDQLEREAADRAAQQGGE